MGRRIHGISRGTRKVRAKVNRIVTLKHTAQYFRRRTERENKKKDKEAKGKMGEREREEKVY